MSNHRRHKNDLAAELRRAKDRIERLEQELTLCLRLLRGPAVRAAAARPTLLGARLHRALERYHTLLQLRSLGAPEPIVRRSQEAVDVALAEACIDERELARMYPTYRLTLPAHVEPSDDN